MCQSLLWPRASKVLILQDFSLSIFELLLIGFYAHTVNIQTQIACFAAHAKLTIYRLHFPILFSGENIIIIYKLKKYGDLKKLNFTHNFLLLYFCCWLVLLIIYFLLSGSALWLNLTLQLEKVLSNKCYNNYCNLLYSCRHIAVLMDHLLKPKI